jgi:hypothetical protein
MNFKESGDMANQGRGRATLTRVRILRKGLQHRPAERSRQGAMRRWRRHLAQGVGYSGGEDEKEGQ